MPFIMWKSTVQPNRPQMTIWRMRIASWNLRLQTHTLRIRNSYCFPLQQWLHERASLLRYAYIACLVINKGTVIPSQARCGPEGM